MNQLIQTIFNDEITQQGLEDLQKKYPVDLKLKMRDDAVFKDGRKTRTECNKMVEAIKRRRLDITGDLKDYADEITADINRIYSVVTIPFLKEDARRKVEAERIKKERDELLSVESKRIDAISEHVADCRGKDSDYIQGIMEAVDLIETDVFDKELIHQAIEVKKTTLAGLAQLLTDTIASEKVEAEREVLRKQQIELEKKQQQVEEDQKITKRIDKLKMIPMNFLSQPSFKIKIQINSLENIEVTEEDFSDKVEEVIEAKVVVIDQLTQMLNSKLRDESAEQEAAELAKAENVVFEAKQKELEKAESNQDEEEKNEIAIDQIDSNRSETPVVSNGAKEYPKDIQFQNSTPKQHYLMDDLSEFCERYRLPEIAVQELFEVIKIYSPMTLLNADGSRSIFDDVAE